VTSTDEQGRAVPDKGEPRPDEEQVAKEALLFFLSRRRGSAYGGGTYRRSPWHTPERED
jgi:hypothetical protein